MWAWGGFTAASWVASCLLGCCEPRGSSRAAAVIPRGPLRGRSAGVQQGSISALAIAEVSLSVVI